MGRITNAQLYERAANVNRRLSRVGKTPGEWLTVQVQVKGRDPTALYEFRGTTYVRTITIGTKREVAEFLHAMMVGIDLSQEERA